MFEIQPSYFQSRVVKFGALTQNILYNNLDVEYYGDLLSGKWFSGKLSSIPSTPAPDIQYS